MGRCGVCLSCVAVVGFWASNEKNHKNVKKFEKANPCVDPTATKSKRKISEVESLFVVGHGGRIQGEF